MHRTGAFLHQTIWDLDNLNRPCQQGIRSSCHADVASLTCGSGSEPFVGQVVGFATCTSRGARIRPSDSWSGSPSETGGLIMVDLRTTAMSRGVLGDDRPAPGRVSRLAGDGGVSGGGADVRRGWGRSGVPALRLPQ